MNTFSKTKGVLDETIEADVAGNALLHSFCFGVMITTEHQQTFDYKRRLPAHRRREDSHGRAPPSSRMRRDGAAPDESSHAKPMRPSLVSGQYSSSADSGMKPRTRRGRFCQKSATKAACAAAVNGPVHVAMPSIDG